MISSVSGALSKDTARELCGTLSNKLAVLPWPKLNGYYLNSYFIFEHMKLALEKFAATGNLDEKVNPPPGIFYSGTNPPETVRGVFNLALKDDEEGGFLQTINAINLRPVTEQDEEIAAIGSKVVQFLQSSRK